MSSLSAAPASRPHNTTTQPNKNTATTAATATPPALQQPISPPSTPKHSASATASRPITTFDATMNRDPLHGAPVRGQVPAAQGPAHSGALSAYGNQDSRANSAVPPVVATGGLKLKRAAVRVLGAAGAASSAPAVAPLHVLGPSKAIPEELKRPTHVLPAVAPAQAAVAPTPVPIKTMLSESRTEEDSALDDLFARLNTDKALRPSDGVKPVSPPQPKNGIVSPQDSPGMQDANPEVLAGHSLNAPGAVMSFDETVSNATVDSQGGMAGQPEKIANKVSTNNNDDAEAMSQPDTEQLYLRKSAEYLQALPSGNNTSVETIKVVSKKLRSSYAPGTQLSGKEAERLKARYTFAILKYVNKRSTKPITSDIVEKILKDADGDMLHVFAKLIEEGYLSLDEMDDAAGLCKIILHALPEAETADTSVTLKTVSNTPSPISLKSASFNPVLKDPLDGLKAWPTQQERTNSVGHRVCILRGVSGIKSINQLQALVWGGRLESIALPLPGSNFAVVRFLTPEACDKYYQATENGIKMQGNDKSLVFVEKQEGPTSINDTIRNCIEGDASRCVRALDADNDWSDMVLMRLAQGDGQVKREVDRIKQGKTSRGRHYIEFRFANIYHALSFKQQLQQNEDWESYTISYAPDPCEMSQGVHYQDEDEETSGFFT